MESNFGANGPWADTDVANTARQESAGLESMSRDLATKDPKTTSGSLKRVYYVDVAERLRR